MNMFEQMPFRDKYPVFRKLAKIGDLRKLSKEDLEKYDEDIKNMRDIYATRMFDVKQGVNKQKINSARTMLADGLPLDKIILYSGLTKEQIMKLNKD